MGVSTVGIGVTPLDYTLASEQVNDCLFNLLAPSYVQHNIVYTTCQKDNGVHYLLIVYTTLYCYNDSN